MIGLSSLIFDPRGALYLYREQLDRTTLGGLHERQRRVTKYKTLDGGVSIVDSGYASGDRSLAVVVVNATSEQVATAVRFSEAYATLTLVTPDGCYRVSPESVQADGANLKINLSFISEA
jgi:hypothetical protein